MTEGMPQHPILVPAETHSPPPAMEKKLVTIVDDDAAVDAGFDEMQACSDALRSVSDNVGVLYYPESDTYRFAVRLAFPPGVYFDRFTSKQLGLDYERHIVVQLQFPSEFLDASKPPTFKVFQTSDTNISKATLDDIDTDFGVVQWFISSRLESAIAASWKAFPKGDALGFTADKKARGPESGSAVVEPDTASMWACPTCTLLNSTTLSSCDVCNTAAVTATATATATESDPEPAGRSAREVPQKNIRSPSSKSILFSDGRLFFLAHVYNYICYRLMTCLTHCLICDADQQVASVNFPICERPQCISSYQETPCGAIVSFLHNQPLVVDFLLSALYVAAESSKNSTYIKGYNRGGVALPEEAKKTRRSAGYQYRTAKVHFEPFPDLEELYREDGSQDVPVLLAVLDAIPSVEEMSRHHSDIQLQAILDEINPLAYRLLQWALKTGRSTIAVVPEDKQIREMGTPYQFQVISTMPEHEKRFRQWRNQARSRNGGRGSFNAFHGSPMANWHSILRTGLRSGFVPGIFMANQAQYSYSYMGLGSTSKSWPNSQFKCNNMMSCMSMVETADMRHVSSLIRINGTGPSAIHIANDKTLVVTRLLFFYPTGPAAMFRASVQADKIFTSDYMFHPMAAVEHAQVQHSHSADDSAPAAHRPKRRRRR